MRLGGLILKNFCDVNHFEYSGTHYMNEGNATTVYLQLVDLDKKICSDTQGVQYLRYMSDTGSSLQVTVNNIDSGDSIQKIATQNATDKSIWSFDLLSTDKIGSANIGLQLTEAGPKTSTGIMIRALNVSPVNGISFC